MRPIDAPGSWSSATDDTETGDLSDLLADPYTKQLLDCLRDEGGEMSLQELSRCVASAVAGDPENKVDESTIEQIEIFMHHGHLPRLSDHGIVQYDPDECSVRLVENDPPEFSH